MSYHDKNMPASSAGSTISAKGQIAPAGFHYMPDGTLMADSEMSSSPTTTPPDIAPPMLTTPAVVVTPPKAKKYGNEFIKEKDGIKAPAGFHYMSNGKLMSDADHIAVNGYIRKQIKVDINTEDISLSGGFRSLSIKGNYGSVFSLEIYDNSTVPVYYNFDTETWTTAPYRLSNVELTKGSGYSSSSYQQSGETTTIGKYNLIVKWPGAFVANGYGDARNFTFDFYAETVDNIKTEHSVYNEVRNADGSVNINQSTGSDSNLLRKIITQSSAKTLTLSCIAPSLTSISANTVEASTSGTNRIAIDNGDGSSNVAIDPSVVQVGDLVVTTGISGDLHALVTKINPGGDNTNEIEISISDTVTNNQSITFTPPFNGMTPNGTDETTGSDTGISASTGSSFKQNFSITCTIADGRTISAFKTPTTDDLCAFTPVTFGAAALAIPGEDTDSAAKFFRWPISNIAGLQEGMSLDPARRNTDGAVGENTTTPAFISKYATTLSSQKIVNRKYYTDIKSTTLNDVSVEGVDSYSNPITAVDKNGRVTAQAGNIVFDVQQADALNDEANVRIFAYGSSQINSLTGMDVSISDVVITPTQVSSTTTAAVKNSTTIPLTDVQSVSTASTVRGPGISSSVANPTVLLKSKVKGPGNITVSSAQTLESGQTLFFDGASNIITITGTIKVSNMALSNTTLYLDVERFLKAI